MSTRDEKRGYSRIAADVAVRWLAVQVDKPMHDYLDEVALNVSRRGMFIETVNPAPSGTLLRLEILVNPRGSKAHSVFAKAIVRWRQRWSRPRGMGVEFVEFEGLGEYEIGHWLESVLTPEEGADRNETG